MSNVLRQINRFNYGGGYIDQFKHRFAGGSITYHTAVSMSLNLEMTVNSCPQIIEVLQIARKRKQTKKLTLLECLRWELFLQGVKAKKQLKQLNEKINLVECGILSENLEDLLA